jgi:hypothetical protein
MSRHLVRCLTFVVLSCLSATPAVAAAPEAPGPAIYDTIDAVEVWGSQITITGIISGQSSPSQLLYGITGDTPERAARCDRLALLAMTKPGKYQLAMLQPFGSIFGFGCKLIVRAP